MDSRTEDGVDSLERQAVSDQTRMELGLQIRRDVLGEAHVERSLGQATEFSRPLQELATEYCWGAVWGRPGLDRQTRSLLNLAMLTALGRQHELTVHVRGAVTNGCTVAEIREVFLQAAVYAGLPAALDAARTAESVLRELGFAEANGDGSSDA
jgi:4-carboxymuconolactone decarboxylase